jgi:hypothetical protein
LGSKSTGSSWSLRSSSLYGASYKYKYLYQVVCQHLASVNESYVSPAREFRGRAYVPRVSTILPTKLSTGKSTSSAVRSTKYISIVQKSLLYCIRYRYLPGTVPETPKMVRCLKHPWYPHNNHLYLYKYLVLVAPNWPSCRRTLWLVVLSLE